VIWVTWNSRLIAGFFRFFLGFFVIITWCVGIMYIRSKNVGARIGGIANLVMSILMIVLIIVIIFVIVSAS